MAHNAGSRSLVCRLHRVGRRAAEFVELTPRQLDVLKAVAKNDGVNYKALVVLTRLGSGTVANEVRRLRLKGLLERRRTKTSACVYKILLTDDGDRHLRALAESANNRSLAVSLLNRRGRLVRELQFLMRRARSRSQSGTP